MHEYASEFCQLLKSIKKITRRFYLVSKLFRSNLLTYELGPHLPRKGPTLPWSQCSCHQYRCEGRHFRSVCFCSLSVRDVRPCLSSVEWFLSEEEGLSSDASSVESPLELSALTGPRDPVGRSVGQNSADLHSQAGRGRTSHWGQYLLGATRKARLED